jgi:hypothetical protein
LRVWLLVFATACGPPEPELCASIEASERSSSPDREALDEFAITVDATEEIDALGYLQEFVGVDLAICSGRRLYAIGDWDGTFPEFGYEGFMEQEMGGVILQPSKLLDGFSIGVEDLDRAGSAQLDAAQTFVSLPYGNRFEYALDEVGLVATRTQYCTDAADGMDLVRDGMGVVEHSAVSMETLDTAVFTHGALIAMAAMAALVGDASDAAEYLAKSELLEARINTEYWVDEEGTYATMLGRAGDWLQYFDKASGRWTEQDPGGGALTRIDDLLTDESIDKIPLSAQSVAALQELRSSLPSLDLAAEYPWTQLGTAVMNTPMEAGIAPTDQAPSVEGDGDVVLTLTAPQNTVVVTGG